MYIFESPIDILSYINLYPTVQGCMVSINGSSMINKVKNLVDKHKDQLKNIYHCFDNDDQGNKFMEKIIEQTKEYNIEHIRNSPKLKDFNDDLINLKMGQ
jgi:ABC-type branched-subunit amino acid transport system substrate-binding protein